jgi:hypothetical protein
VAGRPIFVLASRDLQHRPAAGKKRRQINLLEASRDAQARDRGAASWHCLTLRN